MKQTAFRIPQDQLDALAKIAEREERSMAWLVRKAIALFIKARGADAANVRTPLTHIAEGHRHESSKKRNKRQSD